MKTIELNDEDYKVLMELSKELQTQPNHSQAFPYFWEPASEKLEYDINCGGETIEVYDAENCETYQIDEYAEVKEHVWCEFLKENDLGEIDYDDIYQSEWIEFLKTSGYPVRIYTSTLETKTEHNPSFFKSYVENYIASNKHHLGRNPHTYARSFFRMHKMEQLVQILYRLNPQPEESINEEARRFVIRKNVD